MLHWALARARCLAPVSQVVSVVAVEHERFWRQELATWPDENVIAQPRNRGTAAGLLLPLLHVLRRDPDATVMVLPSDHFVEDERVLRATLRKAARALPADPDRVLLFGMRPAGYEPEYGWILPAPRPSRGVRAVSGFVEKPDRDVAEDLAALGALINSFMLLARGRALLQLYERTLPGLLRALASVQPGRPGADAMEAVYATLPQADFSRDVLERCTPYLSVLTVPACGWSDLGTPARIQMFRTRQIAASAVSGAVMSAGMSTPAPAGA
jgi:mannose-1-phosphate guanylyltransferase